MLPNNHEELNQHNYDNNATQHNELTLDATLYLAYRDIPIILKKHLFENRSDVNLRILDYGCGSGFSTEIFHQIIVKENFKPETFGVDISENNLILARQRLPGATFYNTVTKLNNTGKFDLIICNFVLVENKTEGMISILKNIQSLLKDDGITIITNCTSAAYKKSNKWFSFNNDFPENNPSETRNNKLTFKEDQPLKVQLFTSQECKSSFTFFDFFHSNSSYRKAYQTTGLELLQTYKPIGKESDNKNWKSEKYHPPYVIHVLKKSNPEPQLKNTM